MRSYDPKLHHEWLVAPPLLGQVPSPRGAAQIHILQFTHRPVGSWLHHGRALHPQASVPRIQRSGHHFQDLPSVGHAKKSNHTPHVKLKPWSEHMKKYCYVHKCDVCVLNLSSAARMTGLKDISWRVQWISAGLSVSPTIWRRWFQTPVLRLCIWWQTCCSGIPGRDPLLHR